MPTNALESVVKATGDVEAFGEAICEIYLLLSRDLGEVEMLSRDRIWTSCVAHLCHM